MYKVHKMLRNFLYYLICFKLCNVHAENNGEMFSRILYGDFASIEDYPYFAGLVNCGAVIISERYLLTAAHCFDDVTVRLFVRHAYVGGETERNSQIVYFDDFKIHDKYVQLDGIPFNDVAIIRLRTPLKFSKKVQPIKLPSSKTSKSALLKFIGRGTDETGKRSTELRQMDVDRLTVSECISLIPQQYHMYVNRYKDALAKINICAKRTNNKPGMCFGDSGSPLIQDGVLVGLASYGGASCETDRLGFYVNVAYYTDWIKRVTRLR